MLTQGKEKMKSSHLILTLKATGYMVTDAIQCCPCVSYGYEHDFLYCEDGYDEYGYLDAHSPLGSLGIISVVRNTYNITKQNSGQKHTYILYILGYHLVTIYRATQQYNLSYGLKMSNVLLV